MIVVAANCTKIEENAIHTRHRFGFHGGISVGLVRYKGALSINDFLNFCA
jgi:hypothetical protein